MDVLQLVVAFVPLHPRLIVLSFVGRRWREAVRRAPAHLPGLKSRSYGAACKFFANIASLSFENDVAETKEEHYHPIRDATAPLTSLTSLSLEHHFLANKNYPDVMLIAPLLASNRATLVSISLQLPTRALLESLGCIDLPALRSLSLLCLPQAAEVVAAVLKKLTQLQSLSLKSTRPSEAFLTAVQTLRFPLMSHLTVQLFTPTDVKLRVSRARYLEILEATARIAPNATSLNVGDNSDLVTGNWREVVTHLALHGKRLSQSFSVEEFPHARSMEVDSFRLLGTLTEPLPNIRSIDLATASDEWEPLASFPRLTSLTVTTYASVAQLVALLEAVQARGVPLRHLSYSAKDYFVAVRKLLLPVLTRMDTHGLETLSVKLGTDLYHADLVSIAKTLKWIRMTVWIGPEWSGI